METSNSAVGEKRYELNTNMLPFGSGNSKEVNKVWIPAKRSKAYIVHCNCFIAKFANGCQGRAEARAEAFTLDR